MMKRCLDEGTLQAYLDGELSQERAAETASHLAACEECAAALAAAEAETSFFATAFAPDESVNVPSAVLRSRIGAAVAQLESSSESRQQHSQGRNFGRVFATLAGLFSFTPQGAAAFAGLLAVVALGVIYFASQRPQVTPEVARVNPAPARTSVAAPTPSETVEPTSVAPVEKGSAAVVNVKHTSRRASGGGMRPKTATPAPKAETLPGEREYQTAIASLEKTIKMGGEQSLKASLRVDYERNLALLDNAISQTRQVAAQNPKDKDAVGFLMSAYQSKVELLSKVADQTQVAALGR